MASPQKRFLLLVALVAVCVAFTQAACDSGDPVSGDYSAPLSLSSVEYHPSEFEDPETAPDTSDGFNSISPGDLLVLRGENLDAVQRLYFSGVEASFNSRLSTNGTLIASVPGIQFGELDVDDEYFGTIRATNENSEAILEFPVLPGEPVLTGMSNEYAFPGNEVTLYGSQLFLTESITLPGDGTTIDAADVATNEAGNEAVITIPEAANLEPGPITYETASGTDASTPDFQLLDNENILFNADDYTDWVGWNALVSSNADSDELGDFTTNARGNFLIMQGSAAIPGGGNNEWYADNRVINLSNQQWVAPGNLGEDPGNFAVKFELNFRQEWEGGSILIWLAETAEGYASGYAYRYHAWNNPDDAPVEAAAPDDGWYTVTIPLSDFRTMYGASQGSTPSSLTDLLGSDGTVGTGGPDDNPSSFRLVNYSEREIAAGQAFAIDNIRVSRIAGGEEEE